MNFNGKDLVALGKKSFLIVTITQPAIIVHRWIMEKTTNHSLTKKNTTANNNNDENLVRQLRVGFNAMRDQITTVTENAARYAKENKRLLSINSSIAHQNQELLAKNSYLDSEVFCLHEENNDLISQIEALKKQNFNLTERVLQLQRDANTRTNVSTRYKPQQHFC